MADDDNVDLDLLKKKKKPKKPFNLEKALGDGSSTSEKKTEANVADETAVRDAPDDDDGDKIDFGKKKKKGTGAKKVLDEDTENKEQEPEEATAPKKKSSKKESVADDDTEQDEPKVDQENDSDLEDFGGLPEKKPKKSSKTVSFAGADDVDAGGDEDEDGAEFSDKANLENRSHMAPSAAMTAGAWLGSDRDYMYDELLTRVFDIMREKNPDYIGGEKKKIVMRPPQVVKVGTKKTSFANFTEICKIMRRQPKHLIAFLLAELGTTGSVDANNQLIIKGRFQQKQIENVLRRYIKEYVTCHTCRSPETLLQKDDQTRVVFLLCETCGSRCSVTKVSSGYQAVTAKRAAIRAKEV